MKGKLVETLLDSDVAQIYMKPVFRSNYIMIKFVF